MFSWNLLEEQAVKRLCYEQQWNQHKVASYLDEKKFG